MVAGKIEWIAVLLSVPTSEYLAWLISALSSSESSGFLGCHFMFLAFEPVLPGVFF